MLSLNWVKNNIDKINEFIDNPPFPSFTQFETSTICNANCTFCCYGQMKRSGEWASRSTILKIMDEVVPISNEICPFLLQEPLMEPRILDILCYIKEVNRQCKTTIYTNMSLMTEKKAIEVLESEALDNLVISFYGPTEKIYNKLQPPLNWMKTKENIKRFMRLKKTKKYSIPFVKMHYIEMKILQPYTLDFLNYWKPIVDHIELVHYDSWHGDKPDREREQFWMEKPETWRSPCQRLWTGLNVHYDGTVVPCCIDYNDEVKLGNIHENSLHDIWSGEKFLHFREMHATRRFNEIPLCRKCTVWRYQHYAWWNAYWKMENSIVKEVETSQYEIAQRYNSLLKKWARRRVEK